MAPRASSFAGAADVGARSAWTPEEAAEYAALRDFRLVELLSKNRRALAAAQRLGLFAARKSPRHEGTERTSSAPQRRAAQTQTTRDCDAALNSRQRRSRARAADYYRRRREAEAMDDVGTTPPATLTLAQVLAPPPAANPMELARSLAEGASLLERLRESAAQQRPAAAEREGRQGAATTPVPLNTPFNIPALAEYAAVRGGSAVYGPQPRPHGRW